MFTVESHIRYLAECSAGQTLTADDDPGGRGRQADAAATPSCFARRRRWRRPASPSTSTSTPRSARPLPCPRTGPARSSVLLPPMPTLPRPAHLGLGVGVRPDRPRGSGRSGWTDPTRVAVTEPGSGTPIEAPLRLHDRPSLAEWMDYNGHMSESCYLLAFGDSADAFFRFIGIDEDVPRGRALALHVGDPPPSPAEAAEGEPLEMTLQRPRPRPAAAAHLPRDAARRHRAAAGLRGAAAGPRGHGRRPVVADAGAPYSAWLRLGRDAHRAHARASSVARWAIGRPMTDRPGAGRNHGLRTQRRAAGDRGDGAQRSSTQGALSARGRGRATRTTFRRRWSSRSARRRSTPGYTRRTCPTSSAAAGWTPSR